MSRRLPHPPDLAAVARRRRAAVPDPELPPVTLGMLGMVHAVRVDGDDVDVELLPTFRAAPPST